MLGKIARNARELSSARNVLLLEQPLVWPEGPRLVGVEVLQVLQLEGVGGGDEVVEVPKKKKKRN